MFAGLKALFSRSNEPSATSSASKSVAKSRLHFVLVQDRTGLTNDEMAKFKKELVGVIQKYFMISEDGFDINYKRESDSTTLVINSPVKVRRIASKSGDDEAGKPQQDETELQSTAQPA